MTDPNPLNTSADRIAAAKRAQAAREQGIHANAVKQGRTLERADILKALGVQKIEDASQVAALRAERDARPTLHAYHRHGMARGFQGVAAGAIFGALLCLAVGYAFMRFNTEAVVSGTAVGHQIGQQEDATDALNALERAQ